MKRGFYSALIIAMAASLLMFSAALSYMAENSKNSAVSEYAVKKVMDKAQDAQKILDAVYVDAMIDSAYAAQGCPPAPPNDFCDVFEARFPEYLDVAALNISDAAMVEYAPAEISCEETHLGGLNYNYTAKYSIQTIVKAGNATSITNYVNTYTVNVKKGTGSGQFSALAGYGIGWDVFLNSRQVIVNC